MSALTGGVKNAVDAVSSYFGSSQQPSATEKRATETTPAANQTAVSGNDKANTNLLQFFRRETNAVVEIDDPSQASSSGVGDSDEKRTSEYLAREDGHGGEVSAELQARVATSETLESKRSTTLLAYPYGDSESTGKISVTYGDISRLAPGEFLNDNIIDFYLRCVKRKTPSFCESAD